MSITVASESVTLTTLRRTWRVQLETQLGTDYTLTAHRETVRKVGDTVVAKDQNAGVVSRALSVVADAEVTLHDGTVITPAHIAEALAAFIEAWEVEDNTPAPEAEV